jgi:YHS domain-containing protein
MEVSAAIVADAVCKMELEKRHVKESLVSGGQRYYFCSIGCRAEFERHPEDYVQGAQSKDEVNIHV